MILRFLIKHLKESSPVSSLALQMLLLQGTGTLTPAGRLVPPLAPFQPDLGPTDLDLEVTVKAKVIFIVLGIGLFSQQMALFTWWPSCF